MKRIIGFEEDKIQFSKSGFLSINEVRVSKGAIDRTLYRDIFKESQLPSFLTKDLIIEHEELNGRLYKIFTSKESAAIKNDTVRTGEVYVLGDNRPFSEDSRSFGGIPKSQIHGKVKFIYFNKDSFFSRNKNL